MLPPPRAGDAIACAGLRSGIGCAPPPSRLRFVAALAAAFAARRCAAFAGVSAVAAALRPAATFFAVAHRLATGGTAHRRAQHEDPTDAWHRLAADQPTLVEEPRVLAVELLERVVRQHVGVGAVGDLQDERVAATDRAGRRRDELAVDAPPRTSPRSDASMR